MYIRLIMYYIQLWSIPAFYYTSPIKCISQIHGRGIDQWLLTKANRVLIEKYFSKQSVGLSPLN